MQGIKEYIGYTNHKRICLLIKGCVCLFICVLLMRNAVINGIAPYCSSRDYITIEPSEEESIGFITDSQVVEQEFCAKGNIINRIKIYYSGETDEGDTFSLRISENDRLIWENEYLFSQCNSDMWSVLEVHVSGLERNAVYTITFDPNGTSIKLFLSSYDSDKLGVFGKCVSGTELSGYASLGFQFEYRYIELANLMFFIIRLLIVGLFVLLFCVGVFKFKEIYRCWVTSEKKYGIAYAVYFSITLIFLFNPLDRLRSEVLTYTREMGAGLLANYDASRVISNFFRWFVLFAVLFAGYYMLSHYYITRERKDEPEKVYQFLNKVIILADVNLLFRVITFFYDEANSDTIFYYSSYVLATIIILSIGYIFGKFDRFVSARGYLQLMICAFSIGFPLAIIQRNEWGSGKLLYGMQITLIVVILVALIFLRDIVRKIEENKLLDIAVITVSTLPFLTSVFIEFINILNQHGIFISRPREYYEIICALLMLCGIMLGLIAHRRKWCFRWSISWSQIWIVIGTVSLNQQIALENTYTPDIFESANHSVLINGFLKFRELPIVEHLGHHMMEGVWEGIIYGILNGDYHGAIVSPYSGYVSVVFAFLFYFLIKNIWDKDIALWVTLFFPFAGYWNNYAWGILIALAIVLFIKKNTYIHSSLVWMACAWCCLCKADVALSFIISGIVVLCIYIISTKNRESIRILLIPLVMIIAAGVLLWCILCIYNDINPILRLVEFIKCFAASINWTYNGIGDSSKLIFSWAYFIVPMLSVMCLLFGIFSKKMKEVTSPSNWTILLIMGISYFANFSRALTRHSLHEMGTSTVFWTSYIFLALFISCVFNKKELFLPVYTFFILFNVVFVSGEIFTTRSYADSAVAKVGTFTEKWRLNRFEAEEKGKKTYWEEISDNEEIKARVTYSEEYQKKLEPFGYIINLLLDEDETFLDFIYNSYVYSEYDKRCPVYIAQSPTMMSGQLTQEYFIDEISKQIEDVPIAFMAGNAGPYSGMDGIYCHYKYYKVAEFIYENYRPLCQYGYFSVWCLNGRYEEMKNKIGNIESLDKIEADNLQPVHCNILKPEKGFTIASAENDPYITDLFAGVDMSAYEDRVLDVEIEYESDVAGPMKMFYRRNGKEEFCEGRSRTCQISKQGTANFTVPYRSDTVVGLGIPDGSTVNISGVRINWFDVEDSRLNGLMSDSSWVNEACDVIKSDDGMVIDATARDPKIKDIHSALGISDYAGIDVTLSVDYATLSSGTMQLFYTGDEKEFYNENRCVSQDISGDGVAIFSFPVTEYTKVRLDIPEGSTVVIKDIKLSTHRNSWSEIEWGFDQSIHGHNLNYLPLFWAELDEYEALDNKSLLQMEKNERGDYIFDQTRITDKSKGNYLYLATNFFGHDTDGLTEDDDETVPATVIVGKYEDDEFVERGRFAFTVKEGQHDYLFRVSSDYYWGLGEIDAVRLECPENLKEITMEILQGD